MVDVNLLLLAYGLYGVENVSSGERYLLRICQLYSSLLNNMHTCIHNSMVSNTYDCILFFTNVKSSE